MPSRRIIGLAAPPSLVGVDAVLLEIQGLGLGIRPHLSHAITAPHSRELRELLVRVSTPQEADVRQVSLAHRLLGESFGAVARQLADRASVSLQSIFGIGCGGFTAWHDGGGPVASTLTLGSAGHVAERTGLTVFGDFRARDLACQGQGAPIAAVVDRLLFQDAVEPRLVVHLGGLSSVLFLPADASLQEVVGWQAGPCNVLLDCLIQHLTSGKERWDTGGKHAVQGRQIPELLERWLNHPFLTRRPPKSTHRSHFAEEFAKQTASLAQQREWSHHDLLCTATHLVARAIGDSVRRFLPKGAVPTRAIITGGGVRNGLLWRLLEEQLAGVTLERSDNLGIPPETKEAVDAGLLACLLVDGVPANCPAVTGATGSRLLGSTTPGSQGNWSRCLAWMTGDQRDFLEDD